MKNFMRKQFLLLFLSFIPYSVQAQNAVSVGYQGPANTFGGYSFIPASTTTPLPISIYGGTNGQCLVSNGTKFLPGSCGGGGGSGTVTSITAGTGLTGGTITTSGTIALGTTAVTAGSYTNTNLTVNPQGQITSASNGSGGSVSVTAGSSNIVINPTPGTGTFTVDTHGSAQILPCSTYTTDTAGNLFPYVYTGGGGNVSASEAGWGVVASLAASPVLQMRFQIPSVVPGGTFKLVSYCQANATSGVVKYTPSDAIVASGSSPSAATLTADTQISQTWSSADVYVVNKTTLSGTPTADSVSVVAVTFNATGWTLAQILNCRWFELWE